MMTKEEISKIIDPTFPGVYAPTTAPTKLVFDDGSIMVGYFESTSDSERLEKENIFTFVQFGDNDQKYRATRDTKYITTIDGNKLKQVEYPSYSGALMSKLKKIDTIIKTEDKIYLIEYKKSWVSSVEKLYRQIMYKWLQEYTQSGLMEFSTIPTWRRESNLDEYLTSSLEMKLVTGNTVIIEPVAGMTSEYDGRLDFYMIGNISKKVFILRKILEDGDKWVLANSNNIRQYEPLTKELLLKQITEWMQ